jgi:hypothetical protein
MLRGVFLQGGISITQTLYDKPPCKKNARDKNRAAVQPVNYSYRRVLHCSFSFAAAVQIILILIFLLLFFDCRRES